MPEVPKKKSVYTENRDNRPHDLKHVGEHFKGSWVVLKRGNFDFNFRIQKMDFYIT
jgi:hypothetical protein